MPAEEDRPLPTHGRGLVPCIVYGFVLIAIAFRCNVANPRQHHKATKHYDKLGFIVATHHNNVGRDDLGTPWQESQW